MRARRTPSPVLLNEGLLAFSASGAGHRHREAVSRRVGHGADELLRLGVRDVVRLLVERHLEEADGLVVIDVGGVDEVARRVVGAGRHRHVGQLVDLVDHRVDALAHGGVGQAAPVRGSEDDLLGVAGLRGRHRLEQVDGVERLGVREVEVVRVRRAHRLHGEDGDDEDGDPEQNDEAAMTDTPPSEGAH